MEQTGRYLNWTRDESILALDLYFQVEGRIVSPKDSRVIELSQLLNSLDIHPREQRRADFRNPNGVVYKLGNFRSLDTSVSAAGFANAGEQDREIWAEFGHDRERLHAVAEAIRRNAAALTPQQLATVGSSDAIDEDQFAEGRVLERTHLVRERNPKAVKQKKDKVLAETGTLACEVCGFDFSTVYGNRGAGFIECHHTVPVADLAPGQKTRVADLALVCANCHRMLHRGGLMTIEELRHSLKR